MEIMPQVPLDIAISIGIFGLFVGFVVAIAVVPYLNSRF